MKRLLAVTLLVAAILIVGLGAWAESDNGTVSATWNVVNWIVLYIPDADMSVNLGTDVGSSYYHPDTGTWDPVTDGKNHNAYVITNDPHGYTLIVSADAGSTPADLSRFQIKGGDLTSWHSLDTTQTLKTTSAAAIDHIDNIYYQYLVNETDAPGDYTVTITYTVTTN